MTKYKVKQKIWSITISKYKNEQFKYSSYKDGIEVEELNILGVSPYRIVLNDKWFTTLDNDDVIGYRKDRSYKTYIDDISVSIRTSGFLEPGVITTLYSTKSPDKRLLQKMVRETEKVINKEYGFLLGNVIEQFNKYIESYDNI